MPLSLYLTNTNTLICKQVPRTCHNQSFRCSSLTELQPNLTTNFSIGPIFCLYRFSTVVLEPCRPALVVQTSRFANPNIHMYLQVSTALSVDPFATARFFVVYHLQIETKRQIEQVMRDIQPTIQTSREQRQRLEGTELRLALRSKAHLPHYWLSRMPVAVVLLSLS